MKTWATYIIKWRYLNDPVAVSYKFISMLFDQQLLVRQLSKSGTPPNSSVCLPCFVNWIFISSVWFEDREDIKRIMTAQLHTTSKSFIGALTNRKLTGISVLNTKESIISQINSLFISVYVNTVSVSILIE